MRRPASAAGNPTPFTGPVRPTSIDTDMAADDWMAMLYLLNRPEIDAVAIPVTGTGEAHCEPGIKNATSLEELLGKIKHLKTKR